MEHGTLDICSNLFIGPHCIDPHWYWHSVVTTTRTVGKWAVRILLDILDFLFTILGITLFSATRGKFVLHIMPTYLAADELLTVRENTGWSLRRGGCDDRQLGGAGHRLQHSLRHRHIHRRDDVPHVYICKTMTYINTEQCRTREFTSTWPSERVN